MTQAHRHPVAVDCATALLIAAASLTGLAVQGRLHHPDAVVFCLLLCGALMLRSLSVRWSFAAVGGVACVQWLVSTPQIADAAVLVALFWVALDGELRELPVAAAISQAGAIMAALHWSPEDSAKVWVGLTGLTIAAAALGLMLRERRALIGALHERAVQLELEREQQGRLAAAAERARIAREMHDIVSHNLAVIISLADGAVYAHDTAPQASLAAVQRIAGTGRDALTEMRRLLTVLRDSPTSDALSPQPGLDRLDDLLARIEAAGIPVSIVVEGDPLALPDGVQLTIFRIVQEALTNTLRHAGRPATARVVLRCARERVELEVSDSGRPGSAPPGRQDSGRGLRGMRERAAAYDGEIHTGPHPDGGWRVHAVLHTTGPVVPA